MGGAERSVGEQPVGAAAACAGTRDEQPPTIFDKILAKEIPSEIVYGGRDLLRSRTSARWRQRMCLLIPKRRDGLDRLSSASAEHTSTLGHLLVTAAKVAEQQGLKDFRLVNNRGESAAQSVFHLHLHIIGGRAMTWAAWLKQRRQQPSGSRVQLLIATRRARHDVAAGRRTAKAK